MTKKLPFLFEKQQTVILKNYIKIWCEFSNESTKNMLRENDDEKMNRNKKLLWNETFEPISSFRQIAYYMRHILCNTYYVWEGEAKASILLWRLKKQILKKNYLKTEMKLKSV